MPKVGIGLEWNKKSRLNFATSPDCAYTGVRVNIALADGKGLSRRLRDGFAATGLIKSHKLVTSPWWPAYRYEVATGEYWDDLGHYRAQLIESVRFFWRVFEPRIPDVLTGQAQVPLDHAVEVSRDQERSCPRLKPYRLASRTW
ncbi:hypothetical protein [Sorangium sp. So ce117]|uniref:hypothetical protein n=1 Tax=Sorangium sp. So ce117 TaxID=3133277 RepID=UPI003F5FF20E